MGQMRTSMICINLYLSKSQLLMFMLYRKMNVTRQCGLGLVNYMDNKKKLITFHFSNKIFKVKKKKKKLDEDGSQISSEISSYFDEEE